MMPQRLNNGENNALVSAVVQKFTDKSVGMPLVNNVLRGMLVESIVALALEPEWEWIGGNYSSWDFEHKNGLRLEVKQSAAEQDWGLPPSGKKSRASFDIARRKIAYKNKHIVGQKGRPAHLYLFAYHPVEGEGADHRDPHQWEFYIAAEPDLPDQRSIGLNPVRSIAQRSSFSSLRETLAEKAELISGKLGVQF